MPSEMTAHSNIRPENRPAALRLVSVSVTYPGGIRALQEVSLEVGEGEFVVVCGPSGCGKSTLLRVTAGLEPAESGEIWIGSTLANSLSPKDRDVAMVFQHYALYPHMTVYENMAFGLRNRGYRKADIDRRVHEAAAMLGLEPLLGRKPAALSGGQKQRVAVGRAIVRQPRLFLFDEPLSNLDAQFRAQTRSELLALQRRLGTATVYVTHDQIEAMTMGDRIAVMRDGRLEQVGPPLDVYRYPATVFVARFIGSPPMSILPGKWFAGEGGLYFVTEDESIRISLPGGYRSAMESYRDRRVLLGLRPESVLPVPATEGAGNFPRGTVETVELTGADAFVCVRCGRERLIARGAAGSVNRGDAVLLRVDTDSCCVFDPESERRIAPL